MANVNKVILIGRLTRDVETRTFANGGQVANFGFAVNNRKKNPAGGYDDEPCFLDVSAFGKTAEVVSKYLRKGSQAYLEGHLVLEQWDDKNTGQKRQKLKIVADNVQFLDAKQDGGRGAGGGAQGQNYGGSMDNDPLPAGSSQDIPF